MMPKISTELLRNSKYITPILHNNLGMLVNYGWEREKDIHWLLDRKTEGLAGVWKPKGHPKVFKPEAAQLLKDIANVNK